MYKSLVIARREYRALVRTKAFLFSVAFMPVLSIVIIASPSYLKKWEGDNPRRVIVCDATGRLFQRLDQVLEVLDHLIGQHAELQPGADQRIRLEQQAVQVALSDEGRLLLSEQVRRREIAAFVEIGAQVLDADMAEPDPGPDSANASPDKQPRAAAKTVRIYSDGFAGAPVVQRMEWALSRAIVLDRLERIDVSPQQAAVLFALPVIDHPGLLVRSTDGVMQEHAGSKAQLSYFAPLGIMLSMLMSLFVATQPMLTCILEEKQQRIAEVMLASVHPFEIMAGKLLGTVSVTITIIGIYLVIGYSCLPRHLLDQFLSLQVVAWYILFEVLAVLLYGSVFLAVGAACTDIKETQSLLAPVSVGIAFPLIVWSTIMTQPMSMFSQWVSLFPPATPMLMVLRLAACGSVPLWQPLLGAILVAVSVVAGLIAAGRIFRLGFLMHGKGLDVRQIIAGILHG